MGAVERAKVGLIFWNRYLPARYLAITVTSSRMHAKTFAEIKTHDP